MTEQQQQARLPGWVFLIPAAIIVGLLTWFIIAYAGRN